MSADKRVDCSRGGRIKYRLFVAPHHLGAWNRLVPGQLLRYTTGTRVNLTPLAGFSWVNLACPKRSDSGEMREISEKKSLDSRNISVSISLYSARKLIKYSKPNAVRARRNVFMREFPDFVQICPVCQHSAVLPDISLISLSIGSYLELAIFGEDFPSVASVNVRFS